MTITFREPPAAAAQVLQNAVASLEKPPPGISFLRTVAPRDIAWSTPHTVYHLGLDAIESNEGIDAAECVSWRYLSGAALTVPVAADVQLRAEQLVFGGLHQGPFVNGFSEEVRRASADPELQAKAYEPRLLQIPALYVVALWLHEPASTGDVFIPLRPVNPALEPGRRYSRDQLQAALLQAATKVRAAPANDRGTPGTEAP